MPPTVKKQSPTGQTPTSRSPNQPMSVLDRIQSIAFPSGEGIKIALYGQSGTGKTTLWATFPGPILAIVCSGGVKSGELRSVNTPEYRKKISQVVLHNGAEIHDIVRHVAETGRYKTLVLDHVTGLQDLTMKEILGVDELPAQRGFGMASQQQWGQSTAQCKEYLRAMLNLTCNVVLIGQERTFGGREDGADSDVIRPVVGLAATPSLTQWINPACDYVLQTFKRPRMEQSVTRVGNKEVMIQKRGRGVEYCLRTEPHEVYTTKFRVPKGSELPEVIVDPSYNKIMEIINPDAVIED